MTKVSLHNAHLLKPQEIKASKITPAEAHQKFANSLKEAIDQINEAQVNSSKITAGFINGKVDNLHDVMIAAQKASVTRTAAIEVRNKVIEAYKEIMRMQV